MEQINKNESVIKAKQMANAICYLQEEKEDINANIIRYRSKQAQMMIIVGELAEEERDVAQMLSAAPTMAKALLKVIETDFGCAPSIAYMDELKKECLKALKIGFGNRN